MKQKSTAHSLARGFFDQEEEDERFAHWLETSKLKDVKMGGILNFLPFAQYEKDMECGYDTMNPRAAFDMSGGVFGYPPTAVTVSTSSTNTFASSTESGGTASTFSIRTGTSPVGSQSGAVVVRGSSGSVTVISSKPLSSDITMDDAPEASTDHVVAPFSSATATVPTPPPSQPSKPTTTFKGLGFLPSRHLTSEAVPSPQPAAVEQVSATRESPCAPRISVPAVAPPPASLSQHEEAVTAPLNPQPSTAVEDAKPVVSSPQVGITRGTDSSLLVECTEIAVSPLPVNSTQPAVSLPPADNTKPVATSPPVEGAGSAVFSSLVANANAPTESSRAKIRPKGRPIVPLVEPKEASKEQFELGMGAFGSSNIHSSKDQISAFSNPYFKKLFGDEMEILKKRLRAKEDIKGTDVVFLWRSLNWIVDSHEAKWFDDEIELEDDVAWWRGKLNILRAELEGDVGQDATGIAADTKAKLDGICYSRWCGRPQPGDCLR